MITKWLLFSCILFNSFSFNANADENAALAVGWELWYPYQYRNDKQMLVGLDLDIFNAIVTQANLTVTFTELPWKRHLNYLKTGDMDIAMGASYTEERAKDSHFSIPYRLETVKLFVRKGQSASIKIDNLAQLSNTNFMIGVEGGYYYGKDYQRLIETTAFRAHITEVLDLEQNIQLLMQGHLDGVLVDPFTMQAFIKKYKMYNEFEPHSLFIYSDDIHIMVSKKSQHKHLITKIDEAIKSLKADGTLDEILKNWNVLVKSDETQIAKSN
ncbi:substrate-binding periplasmic protein [Thalassotalea piscium]